MKKAIAITSIALIGLLVVLFSCSENLFQSMSDESATTPLKSSVDEELVLVAKIQADGTFDLSLKAEKVKELFGNYHKKLSKQTGEGLVDKVQIDSIGIISTTKILALDKQYYLAALGFAFKNGSQYHIHMAYGLVLINDGLFLKKAGASQFKSALAIDSGGHTCTSECACQSCDFVYSTTYPYEITGCKCLDVPLGDKWCKHTKSTEPLIPDAGI